MAFSRNATHGTWFQEQQAMINSLADNELRGLRDNFDSRFEQTVGDLKHTYGVNVMADAKRMLENPEIMTEYKTTLLDPILEELRSYPAETDAERMHMEQVADQLDSAWDSSVKSFVVQESYNVSNYLPLSTLDFPALVKQYIRFLGKEIIPVQTASSTNIEQRIFTKYLVNNQTNEEYETPAIYFKKDTDGKPLWKKLWNAGKGYRINEAMLSLDVIKNSPNKKFDIFTWLLDDNGNPMTLNRQENLRARLSYDFNIQFVHIAEGGEATYTYTAVELDTEPAGWPTGYYKDEQGTPAPETFAAGTYYTREESGSTGTKVKLPGGGIAIDIQNGGVFLNGGITEDMKLAIIDEATGLPTGKTVTGIADRLSGIVDFVKGYVTASSCGTIDGIYINGRMSNETNMRTIGFREYPEIRKFLISDGCRFQLPFTVEDFAEANASLNFNLYNRLVQELVTAQEMFEDESILEFLDEEFDKYDGYDSDVWALESYTHTEYVDMDPTALSPNFAGDPWEYRTNAIHNSLASLIYELCDRGKLENLGFVVYGNPKAIRLIQKFVTWTVQKSTEIGGVQMNHSFGVMTDFETPVRVVASNRIDAYTTIPAYQENTEETDVSREYFYHIVAYPMDKFHISYKHLRFARHLTNSPENAAYADAANPGGAAVYVTTSAQYKTIAIQGIQGRIVFKNTVLVPDSKAGLVTTTDATENDGSGTDGGNTP
jgi:hypothetical protein